MLFVYGHTFIKNDEKFYTRSSFNNRLFERYIRVFGDVEVLATQRVAKKMMKNI